MDNTFCFSAIDNESIEAIFSAEAPRYERSVIVIDASSGLWIAMFANKSYFVVVEKTEGFN
jgi:hypothetical protein